MNYKQGTGNYKTKTYQLMETYEALTAENSHTFTFNPIDFQKVAYLELEMDYSATLSQILRLNINGNTDSQYYRDAMSVTVGVVAGIDQNTFTYYQIAAAALLNAVNAQIGVTLKIQLGKAGTLHRPVIHHQVFSCSTVVTQISSGMLNVATDSISSIEITTSTSTWQSGTRMTLWSIARR